MGQSTSSETPVVRAVAHLRRADPVLARLIDEHPDFDPRAWLGEFPRMDLFGALIFQVVGQHISVQATRRIVERICGQFSGQLPSPPEILSVDPEDLRTAGLSRRKIATLRDLAEHFVDGRLDQDRLGLLSDADIEAELTQISGIGPWTVHGARCAHHRFRPSGRRSSWRSCPTESHTTCLPTRSHPRSGGSRCHRGALEAISKPGDGLPVRIRLRARQTSWIKPSPEGC